MVIRNGKVHEIPKKDIVVGDVVILNTGDEIPADGVLLEAVSLQVNESSLTGELMVNKTTDEAHFDEEATYPSKFRNAWNDSDGWSRSNVRRKE